MLIAAFEGWSDAGGAASAAAQWMIDHLALEGVALISSEEFVDFQVHRPRLQFSDDGSRAIIWPDTKLYGRVIRPGHETENSSSLHPVNDSHVSPKAHSGNAMSDVYVLLGAEPSRKWQEFTESLLELCVTWQIDHVVVLGSLFADAPHTRPIATISTSESPVLRAEFDLERSEYEGPAGIASVFAHAVNRAGMGQVSIWASVPHYVHSAPSPKATLALIEQIEELLGMTLPRGELVEQSQAWEDNITSLAAGDHDMAEYIEQLEKSRDEIDSPASTGEAIAHEFEKFLRRDGDNSPDAH